MVLEDGHALTAEAVESLRRQKSILELPNLHVVPLPEFRRTAGEKKLTRTDKEIICEQVILVMDQFYAHLPFKKARYAFDPVQRLRLLNAQISQTDDDLQFHGAVLGIFAEMRDGHTFYGLPAPYRGALAFLPFFMQSYVEQGERRYVVTNVLAGFAHPDFRPGVEVTGWNGMPVSTAVSRIAESVLAGNPAAQFLRGLMRITVRPLTYSMPPDEDVVFVQYRTADDNQERVLVLPWHVASGITGGVFQSRAPGVCDALADQNAARNILWGQRSWDEQERLQAAEAHAAATALHVPVFPSRAALPDSLKHEDYLFSKVPAIFDFQHPSGLFVQGSITPDELCDSFDGTAKRFGYVRIKSFGARRETIFNEFRRILDVMNEFAPDGLILDVRGNPGGSISGAERLLQLLTPHTITPASFHFANTPTIQDILQSLKTGDDLILKTEFADWISDGFEALASGRLVTDGHPLTPKSAANDTGQVYQGPVALIVDATSYSATDIFAGGFQDHGIGLIIGVDDNTGGGGASRWLHHDDLLEKLKAIPEVPLKKLPGGATLGFAHLRSSRVGRRAGDSLEDVGVKCDLRWQLTKKDLMDYGSDLVRFACGQLAALPAYRLEILDATAGPGGLHVKVRTRGLDRLVCYLDEQLRLVTPAGNHEFTIALEESERQTKVLSIQGLAWMEGKLELAAAARKPVARGAQVAAAGAPA